MAPDFPRKAVRAFAGPIAPGSAESRGGHTARASVRTSLSAAVHRCSSLPTVDAELLKVTRCFLVTDKFATVLPVPGQSTRWPERRELIHRVRGQFSDEAAVDLDVVEQEVLEVVERPEARPKSSSASAAPARSPGSRHSGLLDMTDRRRLR